MEAWRLPVSSSIRGKLISAGYTSLSSISSVSSSDLARDVNITEEEAFEIMKLANQASGSNSCNGSRSLINGAKNAWDMLHEEDSLPRITTSCSDLDNILGGGISCRDVTEIGGVPGIGKTQIGIQLSVNVQIPREFGGLGGKAIYIDTEGSFMVERALQIAEACVEDMKEYTGYMHKHFKANQVEMKPKDILENIIYFRVCSYTEQIALVNHLDKFISENKDVKVVIIDSITFHFRQDFDDLAQRTRVLSEMALKFMKLAKKFSLAVSIYRTHYYTSLTLTRLSLSRGHTQPVTLRLALILQSQVVLLNQVTTKYTQGTFQLALALGDSWSHSCTNRVILYWNGDERYAYIDKSPSLPSASASYTVTSRGLRNSSSSSKRVKMM
ncbi:putative DNA repair protein RAD51 [Cardamine amara subsp. amara]|uniref:DNA repair protein RAD51 homolog 3 n=1 Tax=Cardamine amara subsp. amara TaxID=228776 RepID=A0ABD1C2E6_CARAN